MQPLEKTLATTTHGRYLVEGAPAADAAHLMVGFHGYGQSAEDVLPPLRRIADSGQARIVAMQALHRFYNQRTGQVVGSWMTKQNRELMIQDNLEWVRHVLDAELRPEIPVVFAGFSQGVAMTYRAAAGCGASVAAVVALGGDLPPDLSDDELAVLPPVLIGRGREEEWYTREKLESDRERLQRAGVQVELCEYEGGHVWTDEFIIAASNFVHRHLAI